MRLISESASGATSGEVVFRTSFVGDFCIFFVFFLLTLGAVVVYGWNLCTASVPILGHVLFVWLFFWFGLFAWFYYARYRAGLRPGNWLIRARSNGILIKYRSYLNDHYPQQDRVVIDLPWREIEWIRKGKERSSITSSDNESTVHESWTYLDMKLRVPEKDLPELAQRLKEERNRGTILAPVDNLRHELFEARKRKAPQSEIDSLKNQIRIAKMSDPKYKKKIRGKYGDYPVCLVDKNILRVRWNRIKPGIKKALEYFAQWTAVEPELLFEKNAVVPLQGRELEDMILDRLQKGDKIGAVALVKRNYGYSTTEAVKFVEELAGK